ncbi:hypothetical protein [Cohnella massiliensis]|uniref:hypothetical protein n=1 Tax=Cohnella massiliensis TaxID=1816691 RepID=UPI0009BB054B|nr:hypothetical protein [Cohnella massiliensis]
MIQKTIRRAGSVTIFPSLPKGLGMNLTRDFLDQLICGFARQCEKYMTLTGEAPFAFRERQLHSFLAPALSQFSDLLLMETPVNRKWSDLNKKQADSHGWLDYWCLWRNIVLLIELKHSFCSLRSGIANQNLQSDWKKAIEQLDSIKDEALTQGKWCNAAVRIALHVIPVFESFTKASHKSTATTERLNQVTNQVVRSLNPAPNWSGLWVLHQNLVGPYEYGVRKEFYPAVLFAAYVYEISSADVQ